MTNFIIKFKKSVHKLLNKMDSFKSNKLLIHCYTFSSFFLILVIFYEIYYGYISFNNEHLRELSTFLINVSFAMIALGFTIFSLTIKKSSANREKIILRFIGNSLTNICMPIYAYIFSFFDFDAFCNLSQIYGSKYLSFCELTFLACLVILSVYVSSFLKLLTKWFDKEYLNID